MHAEHFLGDTELFPRSTYAGELRAALPAAAFDPARSRILALPAYAALAAVAIVALARHWVPWETWPLVSIAIGCAFAGMTFVSHELLHGGIVRGKALRYALGWVGLLPFTLSPRLWIAWHNQRHHADTNLANDPDGYPTLDDYRARAGARFSIDVFSLGGKRWRGALSLLLGFTVQSSHQLILARARGFLPPHERRLAIAETAAGVALWALVCALVGPLAFVFAFVLPLLVANACVMAFILTNHCLSPRLPINDPLVSGLSVTAPRWLERLTLGFGFHVEHHVFPAMSTRHAPEVRALLRARWPERYQSMSLVRALRELHRTARVYKDDTTLVDPRSGREYATLMPRPAL
jgi:fatty acid desaturase